MTLSQYIKHELLWFENIHVHNFSRHVNHSSELYTYYLPRVSDLLALQSPPHSFLSIARTSIPLYTNTQLSVVVVENLLVPMRGFHHCICGVEI